MKNDLNKQGFGKTYCAGCLPRGKNCTFANKHPGIISEKLLTTVDTRYILISEVIRIYTTIQKWGNSQAVRLPKAVIEKAGLQENDRVEIRVQNGNILIVPLKKHLTLQERAAGYQGDYQPTEWDTGNPEGKEVW